ncbi:MAG: hypothetical protein Q4G04_01040 [bacterium]|nr:hypothetical protein [bacterium]
MLKRISKVGVIGIQMLFVAIFVVVTLPKNLDMNEVAVVSNTDYRQTSELAETIKEMEAAMLAEEARLKAEEEEKARLAEEERKRQEELKKQEEIRKQQESAAVIKQNDNVPAATTSDSLGTYTGKLTGYGPDCAGCGNTGGLACGGHNLHTNGIYYNDATYGSVRILSAARSLFPCGSIVYVDNGILEPFYGIVLDTGGSMINAWNNGNVWVDLAFASESAARVGGATSKNTTFVLKRSGY